MMKKLLVCAAVLLSGFNCLWATSSDPNPLFPAVKQANFVNLTPNTITIYATNPQYVKVNGVFDPNSPLALPPLAHANISQNQPNYIAVTSLSATERGVVQLNITDSQKVITTMPAYAPLNSAKQTTLSFSSTSQTTSSSASPSNKYLVQIQAAYNMGEIPTIYILLNPNYQPAVEQKS